MFLIVRELRNILRGNKVSGDAFGIAGDLRFGVFATSTRQHHLSYKTRLSGPVKAEPAGISSRHHGAFDMSLETLSYMGLTNCIKLSNGIVDVIASTAVGPRLLFYGPTGGSNVLAHFPEAAKETQLGIWKPYGGHRLWVWPEVFPATYAPDNDPIEYLPEGEYGFVLRQPVDKASMQKEIRVSMSPEGTSVRLEHTVTSHCLWPVDIAAWAVSIVEPGTSIVPRVPFQTHDEYVPVTQPLALCAFTDLQDPRFTLGQKYLLLRGDPSCPTSQKLGLRNKQNWCAHLVNNLLFVKRFKHDERAEYPDYGVNTEVYTEGRFQELELLGPHRVVATGESLKLAEEWSLFTDVQISTPQNLDLLDAVIGPRIESLFQDTVA